MLAVLQTPMKQSVLLSFLEHTYLIFFSAKCE